MTQGQQMNSRDLVKEEEHCFCQQGWCARILFQVFCEKWPSLIVILVPHNCPCPEDRVCCLVLSLHAYSLLSHRMLWDFPSQIRRVLFESAQSNSFRVKNVTEKNCLRRQKLFLSQNKNVHDAQKNFDQSTLEMITCVERDNFVYWKTKRKIKDDLHVYSCLRMSKQVQTMQNQFLISLFLRGK